MMWDRESKATYTRNQDWIYRTDRRDILTMSTTYTSGQICGETISPRYLASEMPWKHGGCVGITVGRGRQSYVVLPHSASWGRYKSYMNMIVNFTETSSSNQQVNSFSLYSTPLCLNITPPPPGALHAPPAPPKTPQPPSRSTHASSK